MKEKQFRNIMKKSTLETSEHFVDELMSVIAQRKEAKRSYFMSSFRSVLIVCTVLVLSLTFLLFKVLGADTAILNAITSIQKTLIFIAVTLILLYCINEVIKLNSDAMKSKMGRKI